MAHPAHTPASTAQASFKHCSCCSESWRTRAEFLDDPAIRLTGYQAFLPDPVEGLFLFNHSCQTTLAVKARAFVDLYDGPMYAGSLHGTDACLGHCDSFTVLDPCPNECECAFVRAVVSTLARWPKKPGGRAARAGP